MRTRTITVATILVLGTAIACQAQAPAKPVSAYERLDNSKLADALSALGMTSLLQQLSDDIKATDPADSAYAAGEAMVCQARTLQQSDPEKFIAAISEATKQYEKVIETATKPATTQNAAAKVDANREALKLFRYKLRLADLQGNVRVQPFVERMVYMQGGEEDRARVRALTAQAAKTLDGLHRAINDKIIDIGSDPATRVTLGPDMEELELTISYRMAYVFFYRGMALRYNDPMLDPAKATPANLSVDEIKAILKDESGNQTSTMAILAQVKAAAEKAKAANDKKTQTEMEDLAKKAEDLLTLIKKESAERNVLLSQAVAAVEKVAAQEDNENGLKYWSALLAAQAARELKQYTRAADFLKIITTGAEAEASCRVQALFETVRTLIEKGDFEPAKAAVEDFLKKAGEVLGPSPAAAVTRDVQYALLKNYLYEQWAAAVRDKDPRKADDYLGEAQKPLLKFMSDHPAEADSLAEMLVKKYGEVDPAKCDHLNSMMLLAAAKMEAGRYKEDSSDYTKTVEKAQALLSKIFARTDPITMQVIDDARRLDGYLNAKAGKTGIATRRFRDIATSRPADPKAFQDILNWAILANNIIQDRNDRSEVVQPQVRQELADALEILFKNPAAANNPKADEWRFALAWQYDKLADSAPPAQKPGLLKKAIDNYKLVGKNQPDYTEAQFWACENSVDLVSVTEDLTARKTMAGDLIKQLQAFADECAKQSSALKGNAAKEGQYKQLRDWGARCVFLAGTLYYDQLGMKAEGVKAYEGIAKDWDGTNSVRDAAKTLIQIAILENRTNDAIKLVDDFRVKYPQDAAALIRLVISQLQDKIKGLRNDPTKDADLASYREAYYNFAKILFDQHAKDPEEGQYHFKQLYADGTLELGFARQAKGNATEAAKLFGDALRMFTECRAYDDGRRDQQTKAIDAKFQTKVTAVQNAADAATLEKLAGEFMGKDLAEYSIDPRTIGAVDTVKAGVAAVKKEATAESIASLKRAITNGYGAAARRAKRGLLIDPQNLWGLGRCDRAVKQYQKALEIYKQLINGIDRTNPDNDRLYWQSEYEYADCCMEGKETFPDLKKAMGAVAGRINQLKAENGGDMGGLLGKFNAIQAEAERLSK